MEGEEVKEVNEEKVKKVKEEVEVEKISERNGNTEQKKEEIDLRQVSLNKVFDKDDFDGLAHLLKRICLDNWRN